MLLCIFFLTSWVVYVDNLVNVVVIISCLKHSELKTSLLRQKLCMIESNYSSGKNILWDDFIITIMIGNYLLYWYYIYTVLQYIPLQSGLVLQIMQYLNQQGWNFKTMYYIIYYLKTIKCYNDNIITLLQKLDYFIDVTGYSYH